MGASNQCSTPRFFYVSSQSDTSLTKKTTRGAVGNALPLWTNKLLQSNPPCTLANSSKKNLNGKSEPSAGSPANSIVTAQMFTNSSSDPPSTQSCYCASPSSSTTIFLVSTRHVLHQTRPRLNITERTMHTANGQTFR